MTLIPDRPIDEYINKFGRHHSKLHNRSNIRLFIGYINGFKRESPKRYVTPEEDQKFEDLAKAYLSEPHNYVKDLNNYFDNYPGRCSSMRIHLSTIRTFLEYYDIELKEREVSRIKSNIHSKNKHSPTNFEDFDMELVKKLLIHGNALTRAVILVGITSGARISEIMRLKTGDIVPMPDFPIYKIYINESNKTGRAHESFITSEAYDAVQEFMVERDNYLAHKCRIGDNDSRIDDGRIFPLTSNTFEKMFANILKKCHIYKKDENTGKATIRFHQTRNLFKTTLILNNVPEPVADRFIHYSISNSYNNYTRNELAKQYMKAVPALTTGYDAELKKDNDRLTRLSNELERKLKEADARSDEMIKLLPDLMKVLIDKGVFS